MWAGGRSEDVAFLDPEQEGLFRVGKTSSGRVGKGEATRMTWPPGHTNPATCPRAERLIQPSQPPQEADLASAPGVQTRNLGTIADRSGDAVRGRPRADPHYQPPRRIIS